MLQNTTALIADDNSADLLSLCSKLNNIGVGVYSVSNGADAQRLLLMNPTKFQWVLLDVGMPVLDGRETTRRIRSHSKFAHLPIIAMADTSKTGLVQSCIKSGFNEVIDKDVLEDDLKQVLSNYMLMPANTLNEAL